MKTLFSPVSIKRVITVLVLMLAVKSGWFAVEMILLRAKGIDHVNNPEAKALYYRTRFASQKLKQKHIKKSAPVSDINSFKLLAIYHSPSRTVITVSKDGKTSVLVRGDTIDGYVLDDATAREAIFLRGGKNYRIALIQGSKNPKSKNIVRVVPGDKEESNDHTKKGEVTEGDGVTIVDRTLLDHYSRNMNEIWKNIGIVEVREGNRIKGFRVNFVKRGSDFAKLGLKRGDMIKSINGEELDNYQRAFDIYKNIDTMDTLTMKVIRGKEEMEFEYEIN